MADWVAVVISIFSFGFSIYSLYKVNKKSNAQVELEIKKMINDIKQKFYEEEKNQKKRIDYLIEEELNIYDKACALYKDKKVDKKRFKKDYFYEICNLFNDSHMQDIGNLNNENSKYNNLKDVYNEWKIK